jgi:WD40 repeat protein
VKVSNSGASIVNFSLSPECTKVIVGTNDQCLYTFDLITSEIEKVQYKLHIIGTATLKPLMMVITLTFFKAVDNYTNSLSSLAVLHATNTLVACTKSGTLTLLDIDSSPTSLQKPLRKFSIKGQISAVAGSPFGPILAVGSKEGVLRIFDVENPKVVVPRLLFRERLLDTQISQVTSFLNVNALVSYI